MDEDSSHDIDLAEMKNGFEMFDLKLSNSEFQKLFDTLDVEKSGKIKLQHFMNGLNWSPENIEMDVITPRRESQNHVKILKKTSKVLQRRYTREEKFPGKEKKQQITKKESAMFLQKVSDDIHP